MIALGTLHNFYNLFEKRGKLNTEKQAQEHSRFPVQATKLPSAKFRLPLSRTEDRSGARYEWREFQEVARRFFEEVAMCSLAEEVTIELPSGPHRFDLVSPDRTFVVECKSYTWTKSGNRPSAKWEAAQRACALLAQVKDVRRILAFQDHIMDGKSLAEEFVRLNSRLIADIEVWRYIEGSFERVDRRSETAHGSSEGV